MSEDTSTTAQAREAATTSRGAKWLPMLFLSLGVSMIMVDASVMNVALPTIIASLGISATEAEWANSIYPLVFAPLLITFGRMGDRYGRRLLFVIGAVVFVIASILVAQSDSGQALILARVLQGVGGALMLPTSLSLVNSTFTGRDRAIAFGLWGATIGATAAIGPLLGGWLIERGSWEWAFYINVPIGIILVLGTLATVPESKEAEPERGIDAPGIVLSALGLGLLVYSLIEGQRLGWVTALEDVSYGPITFARGGISPIPITFALSIVLLALFVVVERSRARAGRTALLDLSLFRIPSFGYGNIVALIVAFGEFGLVFALPLFLQSTLGLAPLATGALVAVIALGVFISGPISGPMAAKEGARKVVRLGMALEVIGMVMVAIVLTPSVSPWLIVPGLLVYGAGVGFASAQLTNVVLHDIPVEKSGQGSGAQSTTRQIGSALGIAVIGAVLVTSLTQLTSRNVESIPGLPPEQAAIATDVVTTSLGQAIPYLDRALPPAAAPYARQIATEASAAMTDATRRTALAAAGFVLLGLVTTLKLPKDQPMGRRPEDEEASSSADEVTATG